MKRFILLPVMTALLSVTAQVNAAPASTVSPAERAKIESVVHDYLIQQPEVIAQAIQALQQKQYQEAEKTVQITQKTASNFATQLFHQNGDPVVGNPNGKVTVVEFFDYQCPHCVDMAPVMSAIIKANPDVRVVYKEFPIRGPMSEVAAKAALAANKQGKYSVLSHALLTNTQPLTETVIFQLAQQNGLDVEKLKKDMNDHSISEQLKRNTELAQQLKLFGTPALFIGKTTAKEPGSITYVPGQMTQAQLQEVIDKLKS